MPPTYARVVASSDHEARWYVGHVGAVVHVSDGNPKLGWEALLILQFANGVRDVFRAHELAPARQGDAFSPDAKPVSGARKPEVTLKPRAKRPRAPVALPGFCVHGHPRADPSEACRECDRLRKLRGRASHKVPAEAG